MELFSRYIAFQMAKGNSFTNLEHQIGHAKRVIQFLERGSATLHASANSIKLWLHRLKHQLSSVLLKAKADIAQLEVDGAWADAKTVVTVLETFRVTVLRELPEFGDLLPYLARLLHDACLVNVLFGYLPPIRISCVIKLQMPSAQHNCLDVDCRISGCKGNRLELRPDGMYMVLPHHKNTRK